MDSLDILLVDDETRRMRATIEMLRSDGFSVEQIASPSEAMQRLNTNPQICKVIILDIMMPADGEFDVPESQYGLRTGFLLLDKLHTIEGFRTPIIVLTANASFEDELGKKIERFLVKPVAYNILVGTLRDAIKKNGG